MRARLCGWLPANPLARPPAFQAPRGIDVLALGRDVQPLARASEGGDLGVQTLQLLDPLLPLTPMVSGLQADISYGANSHLYFTCKGR